MRSTVSDSPLGIDPQGKIVQVFADVKPAVHSRQVLAALDALGAAAK